MAKIWYAIQGEDDNDWGYGSHDKDEAIRMLNSSDDFVMIAVIEESDNPVCIEEIYKSDL